MSNAAVAPRRRRRHPQLRRNTNPNLFTDTETGLNPAHLLRPFTAAPQTAQLRWISLVLLSLVLATTVSIYGVGMARDNRAIGRVDSDIARANLNIDFLEILIANFTGAPNCTLDGNTTITSNFSDAAFGIFSALNSTAEFVFELSGLDPSSLITLTIQDASGVVAYLTDIPGIGSVFQDDVFTVQNAAQTSRQIRLFVGGVSGSTTQVMTIQDASGTVAYLSDIAAAFTSVFDDDVFAVQNAIDNTKEVMLFVGNVSASTTIVMTVQDASGTIAYLSDIVGGGSVFLDSVFGVFDNADPSKLVRLNCSFIMGSTLQTMTVQDADGTIAYLADVPQIIEVFLNTSRSFPDMANEGVSTLAGLGSLSYIEISLCGGGGGGGANTDGGPGGAGGSGSGHENFKVYDPTTKFTSFNCSIGMGGVGGPPISGNWGQNGNATSLMGISSADHFLELFGYGGGGGKVGDGFGSGGSPGGSGGGGGGNADRDTPGIAGIEGGLIGGQGAIEASFATQAPAVAGGINLSWRAGGGGGGGHGNVPAAWQGGFGFDISVCTDPFTGCGASSMFGVGGNALTIANGGPCAGGGNNNAGPNGGDGGDGAVLFRYLIL